MDARRSERQAVDSAIAGQRVVLYTIAIDSGVAAATLNSLRKFAESLGCDVAAELYDMVPVGTPRSTRTGWLAIEQYIVDGKVQGVIATTETEIAFYRADRTALRSWLLCNKALACYLLSEHGPRSEGGVRA
ncbi:hypothetical protein GCM10020367_20990 [Streptomyces sannanensis]|uniref:Recombinase family protein n=2 Tax=Streptomyces sannanensis TaxID=285536 RepID=A0ABP6S9G0_9ACTN